MTSVTFAVDGIPRPQGSMRPWISRPSGRVVVSHSGGMVLARWRADVHQAAIAAMIATPTAQTAVELDLTFYLPRPRSHVSERTGAKLASWRPAPDQLPDVDKLARAVLDSLTAVVYGDDAQVVALTARKAYADNGWRPGVTVTATWEDDDV
jgi:crossover junction endodeoxyribonuclease RusA